MSVEEDRLEIVREEASLYGRIRDKLLMEHRGEWVALRKGALLASSNDLSTLLKEVFERLGDEPVYVTKVGEEEKVGRRVYRLRRPVEVAAAVDVGDDVDLTFLGRGILQYVHLSIDSKRRQVFIRDP